MDPELQPEKQHFQPGNSRTMLPIVKQPRKSVSQPGRERRKISRSGCIVCKRRKIKCGEEHPSCLNCIKHSASCKYQLPTPSRRIPAPSSKSPDSSSDEEVSSFSLINAISLNTANVNQLPDFKLFDLELLHTFNNFTCLSISHRPAKRALWRTKVPKIGFSYSFVMRGLLAITASHLGHVHRGTEEKEAYHRYAADSYEKALHEATKLLPSITSESATALFLFEAMNCLYLFGRPRNGPTKPYGGPGAYDWIDTLRGINAIHDNSSKALSSGPLALLIKLGEDQHKSQIDHEGHHLNTLRHFVLSSVEDQYETQLYSQAINDLEKIYVIMAQTPNNQCEPSYLFRWMFEMPEDFYLLLKAHRQEALAIFAHGCVLFKKLESFWWLEGWGEELISQIYVLLDLEHQEWIRWPLEQIGWVPHEGFWVNSRPSSSAESSPTSDETQGTGFVEADTGLVG